MKELKNVQGAVTQKSFPIGHWQMFNKSSVAKIALETATLFKSMSW